MQQEVCIAASLPSCLAGNWTRLGTLWQPITKFVNEPTAITFLGKQFVPDARIPASSQSPARFSMLMHLFIMLFSLNIGLCPDWEDWDPKQGKRNATEAMDLAEEWLEVPQVCECCQITSTRLYLCWSQMFFHVWQFRNTDIVATSPEFTYQHTIIPDTA